MSGGVVVRTWLCLVAGGVLCMLGVLFVLFGCWWVGLRWVFVGWDWLHRVGFWFPCVLICIVWSGGVLVISVLILSCGLRLLLVVGFVVIVCFWVV